MAFVTRTPERLNPEKAAPEKIIPKKRLFICCDGTTNDAIRNKNDMITNVARFTRCLKSCGDDGVLQMVYYHEGIGTQDGKAQWVDSGTGGSIHGDIQDCYYFLCLNYHPGDEIHLIGFSRGAFTVRALACFLEDFGILAKSRLAMLKGAYEKWLTIMQSNPARMPFDFQMDILEWADKGHLFRGVAIEACAVWDTVRALYLTSTDMSSVSGRTPTILKNAFQALSLHETRKQFPPELWRAPSGRTVVRQTWFAGDHSDIGGGHLDSGLSTVSLLWMMAQFREFTNAAFEAVMVFDCMTPLYLHWEKETFVWYEEYYLQDHIWTLGRVHGKESWGTKLWPSNKKARETFVQRVELRSSIPPAPMNRAKLRKKDLDWTALESDEVPASRLSKSNEGHHQISINEEQRSHWWPTIHHTVRLLKHRRGDKCPALDCLTTKISNNVVAWVSDSDSNVGLWEDRATEWELWMYRQWIKREEEAFRDSPGDLKDLRFTAFLYKYRNEMLRNSEEATLYRSTSDEKQYKTYLANKGVGEPFENEAQDSSNEQQRVDSAYESDSSIHSDTRNISFMTFSVDSNATSVNRSGVRYPIEALDIEGAIPERPGKLNPRRLIVPAPPAQWVQQQLRSVQLRAEEDESGATDAYKKRRDGRGPTRKG